MHMFRDVLPAGMLLISLYLSATLVPQQTEPTPPPQRNAATIDVPETDGQPIMIDGIFSPDEWGDAAAVRIGAEMTVLVKQEKGHLFIGVRHDSTMVATAANLFIQPADAEVYQLHASAQIGEITLAGPNADDPRFRWGYSPGWTANEGRWDQARVQELLAEGLELTQARVEASYPMQGYEFQIRESRFKTSKWRVRVEIDGPERTTVYPPGTERNDTSGWLVLRLGGPRARR